MPRHHGKFVIHALVCAQEYGNVQFLCFLYIYIMPKPQNRVNLEFPCQLDYFHGVVPGLRYKVGHRVEYASALRVGILDESIEETSF